MKEKGCCKGSENKKHENHEHECKCGGHGHEKGHEKSHGCSTDECNCHEKKQG